MSVRSRREPPATAAYGHALGFSPCQIELLEADIDRFVRTLARAEPARQRKEKQECPFAPWSKP